MSMLLVNHELNKLAKTQGITLTGEDVKELEKFMFRVFNVFCNLEEMQEQNLYGERGERTAKEYAEDIKEMFRAEEEYMHVCLNSENLYNLFAKHSIDIE